MRIIAGEWRGRRILAPRDRRVRPTGDRAREAWMSMVQPHIAGARVLDLFAGSGALGLEALSRGASSCHFVDVSEEAIATIRRNGESLGALDRMTIHRAEVLRLAGRLRGGEYDVAFADPPYGLGLAPRLAALWLERAFVPVLGIEHDVHERLPAGGSTRAYGGTGVTIFRAAADAPSTRGAGE